MSATTGFRSERTGCKRDWWKRTRDIRVLYDRRSSVEAHVPETLVIEETDFVGRWFSDLTLEGGH